MALSLEELTTPKTTAQTRSEAIGVLSGRGIVTKVGEGTGSVSLTGTPTDAADVVLEVVAGGGLGVATYQLSVDGGETFGAVTTLPSNGQVDTRLGVIATFASGSAAAALPFVAGDTFSFSLKVPTFAADSWREDDTPRALVEIGAQGRANHSSLTAEIAKGGLLEKATGSWLKLLAKQKYGIDYNPALTTQGNVTLTASAEAGPFAISAGQLWFAASNGLRYRSANTSQITLAKGGTLVVPVEAESPGAAYNVAAGTIRTMVTPLAGVTVDNPGPSWTTRPGVDEEADAALRARCRGRWAELGTGSPAAAYDLWARTANGSVTRTKVRASSSVAGQVDVYLAGPAGGVGSDVVAAVQAYVTPRAPLGSTPVAASASALAITVTATLYGKAQYEASAKAAAQSALEALIAATPIGGTVYRAAIIEALMSPAGVENVVVSAPSADAVLTVSQVATLTLNPIGWTNT